MAAVLNFDTGSHPSGADVDRAVSSAFALLAALSAGVGVPLVQKYRHQLAGIEADLLAKTIEQSGGGTKRAERVVSKSGKVSRSAAKKAIARAKLNAKNPDIGKKLATEELTDEQVDVIADADRKTDGAAGTSADFIDAVAKAGVDQARGVAADFVTDHANADGTQTEHDRQRLLRKATKFTTELRTKAILLDGDASTIDRIWAQANRRADELYRHDGGRDVAVTKHARTSEQRLFDALVDIFENGEPASWHTTEADSDNTTPGAAADANTTSASGARGADGRRPGDQAGCDGAQSSKRHTPKMTRAKPVVVVMATLEKFLGLDPDAAAEMIGTGPIADSVLAQYVAADADIVGMIFGLNGQPLWLSRSTRLATHAQHLALIIRDKRCVLCGADHHRCRAHHTMPWSAPAQGETDITKLVLVCDSCHHHIHDNNQTIFYDAHDRQWKLRPALPHEIAQPRPPQPGKGHSPQRT